MHKFRKAVLYIILLLIAFIMLMPFYMMFVMSTLSTDQIYSFPPIMWFGSNAATNFVNMLGQINILRAFGNSCIVSISYTALCLLFVQWAAMLSQRTIFRAETNYLGFCLQR